MSQRRIRILYLVSTLRRAGPNAQLLNLLRHLDPSRFEPTVVTLSPEGPDSMLPAFSAIEARVRSLAMSRMRGFAHRGWGRTLARVAGAPLDEGSIVHSQGIRGDVIASTQLAGVTRVATARNDPLDDYPMKFGNLPGRWMARRHLRAFRALPQVVACSSELAKKLRAHGVEAAVIRNGVDTDAFRPASAVERAALRDSLDIAPAARVAVAVGALSARKDPGLLVRALRAVSDPDVVLAFLGAGELEADCRRAASDDRRVRFVGQVADVTPWLRAADFLVSASRSEGLPNAVLEALACGLRLVLTDIGPHRELLALCPGSGEAFRVGDERGLADAIARAARRAATAGVASTDGVAALLGAQRMSQEYQQLYLRLAGAAGRP